jgi:hypothetical protein
MKKLSVDLYYLTLELHSLAIAFKEIPAPELDLKYLLERKCIEIQKLLDGIKEGE